MQYNKFNFFRNTFCLFQQVNAEELVNLQSNYKSTSGSEYFFTETGVYRKSNHWGRAANCRWRLITNDIYKNQQVLIGFAHWNNFFENNDVGKLFYIEINSLNNDVTFNHKNNPNYNSQMLRNAGATTKRIQEIKKVLANDIWAKYLVFNNFEEIKHKILSDLINTNESFVNLKSKLQNI